MFGLVFWSSTCPFLRKSSALVDNIMDKLEGEYRATYGDIGLYMVKLVGL